MAWFWTSSFATGITGAGATTLTADPGTVAVTGTAAGLLYGRVLVADAGSVAITGTDAGTLYGRVLAADAGSIAVTGTAADLLRGYAVTADAGSVAVTGTAAELLTSEILLANDGAIFVYGTAASLLVGRVLVADAGSVAITGTAADLLRGYVLAADAGAFAVTGTDAELLRGMVLAADAGSVAVSGTAAELLRGLILVADAGTVTITGTAATLQVGTPTAVTLVASAGTFTVAAPVETYLSSTAALIALPLAPILYPRVIQPRRWATNGRPPDVRFLRELIRAQNHSMAYRRKTFLRWGDLDSPMDGLTGDTTRFRFRCHTGYGAIYLGFHLALGYDDKGLGATPAVQIEATPVGGAASSVYCVGGQTEAGTSDAPDQLLWRTEKIACLPNTTYEVRLLTKDYGRLVSLVAYEIASPFVDARKDWYVYEQPGVESPVYDSTRERILRGLSELWRRNGSHLYSWPGSGSGTSPTFTSSWTNIIDSGAAPGFSLGDSDIDLLAQPRSSDGTKIDVVLAAHGSVASGSDGEVRLEAAGGTLLSLTGIGTTSQWYATTGQIDLDGLTGLIETQARSAASTLTLNAVSLYTYA